MMIAQQVAARGGTIMKRKGADPTIVDVAQKAGVSIATVSRVLNAKEKVRPSTRVRVLNAMDELGYSRASFGRSDASEVVVVVLPNLDNPFYAKIIQGLQASAKGHGLETLIHVEGNVDARFEKVRHMLEITKASGQVILSPVNNLAALNELNRAVPLVQCAEYNEHSELPYVGVDDVAAAKGAMEMLLQRGRRRIALINGPEKYKYSRQRYRGYAEALEEAGIAVDPLLTARVTEMGFDSSLAVARQMLLMRDPPDAILATSDMYASAVVKAASGEGIRIPGELSLIGFDNTYISQMSHPSVTAVNMPQFQLGYMAGEVLAERMKNPRSSEHKQYLLKTELVIRESV